MWTLRVVPIQQTSPAQLVARQLYKSLGDTTADYTYVDFCAGAGGPTPFIEKHLNSQLSSQDEQTSAVSNGASENLRNRSSGAVVHKGPAKFVLTDLHPHIPDWTEAAKQSDNLTFVSDSVDAANAPVGLAGKDGKKIFRLYNLAFHHFDDDLGSDILRNTIETADGFGYLGYSWT